MVEHSFDRLGAQPVVCVKEEHILPLRLLQGNIARLRGRSRRDLQAFNLEQRRIPFLVRAQRFPCCIDGAVIGYQHFHALARIRLREQRVERPDQTRHSVMRRNHDAHIDAACVMRPQNVGCFHVRRFVKRRRKHLVVDAHGSLPIARAHELLAERRHLLRVKALVNVFHPVDKRLVVAEHRPRRQLLVRVIEAAPVAIIVQVIGEKCHGLAEKRVLEHQRRVVRNAHIGNAQQLINRQAARNIECKVFAARGNGRQLFYERMMLDKQHEIAANRSLQAGNIQLVGPFGRGNAAAKRRRVQQHALASHLRNNAFHAFARVRQKLLVEEYIRAAYAKRLDDFGAILQHHGLFIRPSHIGAANGNKRKVLVERMAQKLFSGAAEFQVGRAHAPLLERAACMPQLHDARFRTQLNAADQIGGIRQKDHFSAGNLVQRPDAVLQILHVRHMILVERHIARMLTGIQLEPLVQQLEAVGHVRFLRLEKQHPTSCNRLARKILISNRERKTQRRVLYEALCKALEKTLHAPSSTSIPQQRIGAALLRTLRASLRALNGECRQLAGRILGAICKRVSHESLQLLVRVSRRLGRP